MSLKSQEAMSALWDEPDAEGAADSPEPVESSAEPVVPEQVSEPAESAETKKTELLKADRDRDEVGKFVPKADKPAKVVKPAPIGKAAALEPVKPTGSAAETQALKAPSGWGISAKEQWSKLPAEVQQESIKREREAAQAIARSGAMEKYLAPISQAVAPYQAMIQSSGSTVPQIIGGLLQSAHTLMYGPMPHKAGLIAHLIKQHGVDVKSIADSLDGQPQQQTQQQHFDPNQFAAQLEQRILGGLQSRQSVAQAKRAESEVESFLSSKEFSDEIREEMADVFESAARRGKAISMEEAYNKACLLHPEISAKVQQREAAKRAEESRAKAQRSRAASSSIRGQPALSVTGDKQSLSRRELLEAAWDDAAAR